ncbi:L-lactate dehydrogenase B-B chain [Carassius carassius]|uniref:L-lactate dehydrogenase B-B chain n=1 Tax=Carassius carassius TaxID=217509 RepID=UPI002868B612|nr:L-lactate dehydrogenase B-B chain [Carassius carassius]
MLVSWWHLFLGAQSLFRHGKTDAGVEAGNGTQVYVREQAMCLSTSVEKCPVTLTLTNWAIGLSVADLTESHMKNLNRVHPVCTMVKGLYSISDEVYPSLPSVLNSAGVGSVVNMSLSSDEVLQLKKSADVRWHIQRDLKHLLTTNGYYSQLRTFDCCYDKTSMPKIFLLTS